MIIFTSSLHTIYSRVYRSIFTRYPYIGIKFYAFYRHYSIKGSFSPRSSRLSDNQIIWKRNPERKEEAATRGQRSRCFYTHMGVCQQLLHDEIVVDLFGKFSPLFRAFEFLVRLDLQCINEKFLMELDGEMRATTLLELK